MRGIGPAGLATLLVFFTFGASAGVMAGTMPLVIGAAKVSGAQQGLAVALGAASAVAAMVLGGRLATTIGPRRLLLLALPAMFLALQLQLATGSLVMFFVALALLSGVLGFTDTVMNTELGFVEREAGRPVFTRFHGACSLGTAIFAITASVLASWSGLPTVAALIAVLQLAALVAVYRATPERMASSAAADAKTGGSRSAMVALPAAIDWRRFSLLGVAAGFIMAVETVAVMFSAQLLSQLAPSLVALSGLAVAFFGLCNALVRFGGDALRARFGDRSVMLVSMAVAMTGFLGIALAGTSFAGTVACFALVGFGIACLIPCIFAMAARENPAQAGNALGLVSLVAGLPRSLLPWAFGALAGSSSLALAYGACIPALLIAMVLIARLASSPVPAAQPAKS
jgi:MFS family permease